MWQHAWQSWTSIVFLLLLLVHAGEMQSANSSSAGSMQGALVYLSCSAKQPANVLIADGLAGLLGFLQQK